MTLALLTRKVLWALLGLLCIGFAAISYDFLFVLKTDKAFPYADVLAFLTSHEYSFGARSGMEIMPTIWSSGSEAAQWALGVHAFLASVCLVLGLFQLSPWSRKHWLWLHRKVGKVYIALGIVSILCSVIYLSLTPLTHAFGGRPFAIGLWGIAIVSLYTFIMGYFHVRRGEIWQHQSLLVLNFCLLLIAPALRFWWVVFGNIFSGYEFNTQMSSHVAALLLLGLQSFMAAIIVVNTVYAGEPVYAADAQLDSFREKAAATFARALWPLRFLGIFITLLLANQFVIRFSRETDLFAAVKTASWALREQEVFRDYWWAHAAFVFGTAVVLWVAPRLIRDQVTRDQKCVGCMRFFAPGIAIGLCGFIGLAWGFGTDGIGVLGSGFYWGTLALCIMILGAFLWRAYHRDDRRATAEFTIHIYALFLVPVTLYSLMAGFSWFDFPFRDAFLSAAVTATSMHLAGSYYYTTYARRLKKI